MLKKLKDIINKYFPVLGGVSFYFLLMILGIITNPSISYMGNKSEKAESIIFGSFLIDVILAVLKVLFVYLIVGLIFGIIIYFCIWVISGYLKKEISKKKGFFLTFGVSFFVYLVFFFKNIILYPQLYMNNFYNKNFLFKFIVEALTDNFNPIVFTIIQVILILSITAILLIYLFSFKNRTLNRAIYSTAGIFFIIFLFSYIHCGGPGKTGKPNILVLATDALRPDHLSGFGYPVKTSPNIDRLISRGVSFKNTYIEVPRTFPSWVSILTGHYASTHGIRHMFPTSRDINRDFKSIAKQFRKNDYYTAVVADYAGDIFSRIDLGFEKVDTPYFNFNTIIEQGVLEKQTFLFPFLTNSFGLAIFPSLKDSAYFCPPDLLKDKVLDVVRGARGNPFFIVTFFSSTHFPYAPPYPYYNKFAVKDYNGPYKYYKQRIIALDKQKDYKMSDNDIKQIRALYDGGINAFDDALGKILEYLEDKEILDNTMIVLISDHGENLYEDNLGMGHGEHFRGPWAIKIPFIIRYPSLNKKKMIIDDIARVVDIAPTILDAAGLPIPGHIEGLSMLPVIKGKRYKGLAAYGETGIWFDNDIRDELFFQRQRIMYPDITFLSEVDPNLDNQIVLNDDYRDLINLAKHRYVFDGRYKLIYMPMRSGVKYELYDTLRDPSEKENIAGRDAVNFLRMKKLLFKWITRNDDVVIKKEFIFPILRY